jgi:hypothetical protein
MFEACFRASTANSLANTCRVDLGVGTLCFNKSLALLFQTRRLASTVTQIIEFGPADFRSTYDVDFLNARGVQEECTLYADTVSCNASHGETPVHASPANTNNGTLKDLDAFPFTFYNS